MLKDVLRRTHTKKQSLNSLSIFKMCKHDAHYVMRIHSAIADEKERTSQEQVKNNSAIKLVLGNFNLFFLSLVQCRVKRFQESTKYMDK